MSQRLLRSSRLLWHARPNFNPTITASGPINTLQRKYVQRAAESQAPVPDFAFAFEWVACVYHWVAISDYEATSIDGVLLRSSNPIPGAAEALTTLKTHGIPFILLTNGGGKHEDMRIAEISNKLHVPLDPISIVQSHSPFAEFVDGMETESRLKDKCVMVLGGDGDDCRKVAERYNLIYSKIKIFSHID